MTFIKISTDSSLLLIIEIRGLAITNNTVIY